MAIALRPQICDALLPMYNHCGAMAAWSPKTLKKICVCWKITTPYGEVFKILFGKFSSRHRSTRCVQISWNLADRKCVKSSVIYLINFAWPSSCRYCAVRAQNMPGPTPRQYTQSAPDFIQFASLLAKLYSNAWTPCAPTWIHIRLKPSFEPNNKNCKT